MDLIKSPLLCPASCLLPPASCLLLCDCVVCLWYAPIGDYILAFWLVAVLFVVAALLLGLVDRMITSSSRE